MNKKTDELLDEAVAIASRLPYMSSGLASDSLTSYAFTLSDLPSRMRTSFTYRYPIFQGGDKYAPRSSTKTKKLDR